MTHAAPIYSVYLVRCADASLYCGIAIDVAARLVEHNTGARGARYTRSRRPVTLVYSAPCGTRSDALKREIQIKRLPRAAKESLIQDTLIAS